MRRKLAVGLVGVGLLAATPPLWAHHSFSAEFDVKRPVHFKATVAKMEWINPHSWLHVDVPQPDGTVQRWMIEGGTPNSLLRRGFTRDSLKVGTLIVVDGYQARDGSRRANGRDLTLPDGRKLFLGSPGTGAPQDGRR
jgi:uncharacterized protein DUF6152